MAGAVEAVAMVAAAVKRAALGAQAPPPGCPLQSGGQKADLSYWLKWPLEPSSCYPAVPWAPFRYALVPCGFLDTQQDLRNVGGSKSKMQETWLEPLTLSLEWCSGKQGTSRGPRK